jgi:ankyrin repeat protein
LKIKFFCSFVEACFYGNLEIVKILVENGANVNGNQTDERSPGEKKR